jgi:transglutaminase-like putative cysteine protease
MTAPVSRADIFARSAPSTPSAPAGRRRQGFARPVMAAVLAGALALAFGLPAAAQGGKSGTVTFEFDVAAAVGAPNFRLWVPYPISDANQDIGEPVVSGNYKSYEVVDDAATRTKYLSAVWENVTEAPKLSFAFHVDSHYSKGAPLEDGGTEVPEDIRRYLESSDYIPCVDPGIVADAEEATASATTLLEKARGVYDWTIAHTFRNPDVKGCGLGRAIETLTKAQGGGKCADISSVFVTVLRAAGVPSRDVFGLRSGGKSGEITGDFHCWSEFYLPGTGWVQADPADVRKAMLVEKFELEDPKTAQSAEFFWNGDDLFRIALNRGDRGLVFKPAQQGPPLEYFMYPFGQVDGVSLDYFDPKAFGYKVTFKLDSEA